MGDATYTLNYFDVRGLAEPIRFILSYAGAKWEDERVPFTSFPPSIPAELKARLPFGQVPFLEIDGQGLSQSTAIARYLARKYNLVGEGELEAAQCDEIVDAAKDYMAVWSPFWVKYIANEGSVDETEKAEALRKIIADSSERFLTKFESILVANGGHFVGQKLTWADITVAYHVDNIQTVYGTTLTDDFPAIKKLIETVYSTSGIKEWIEKRPKTKF